MLSATLAGVVVEFEVARHPEQCLKAFWKGPSAACLPAALLLLLRL